MRILYVAGREPWPPRRGDQLRTTQMAELLAAAGHQVTVLAPAGGAAAGRAPTGVTHELYRPPSRLARALGLVAAAGSGRPLQAGLFRSAGLRRRVRELAPRHELGILQLVRLASVRSAFGDIPVVADLVDSLSLNFERRAEHDRRWLAPLLRLEAGRLLTAERRLIRASRTALLVSERDRRHLARRLPEDLASRLTVLPLAVERPPEPPERKRPRRPIVALTGNLGYFVNRDAVLWWLATVHPRLAARRPDLQVLVAGARPPREVRRACRKAGVDLLASPPDLAAVLARAAVALAPMRSGSGLPIKVLEAWSLGVPVVASPWAAAGTTGVAGEDLLVAETADEWVGAIARLLDDRGLADRVTGSARRRLAADYSRSRVAGRLDEIVQAAATTSKR